MMTASTKTWILWGALLITLGLVWKTQPEDMNIVKPSRTLDNRHHLVPTEASQTTLTLTTRQARPSLGDLFANRLTTTAQTLIKSTIKPPVPTAPPLPFEYMGRWQQNGELTLMLMANDEIYTVKQGEILLETYQLTEITESNLGISVGLMYLPLKQMQFLQVGKAKNE